MWRKKKIVPTITDARNAKVILIETMVGPNIASPQNICPVSTVVVVVSIVSVVGSVSPPFLSPLIVGYEMYGHGGRMLPIVPAASIPFLPLNIFVMRFGVIRVLSVVPAKMAVSSGIVSFFSSCRV